MRFKTEPVYIPLYGHGLESIGNIDHEPTVCGTFQAEPVTGKDGIQYAIFEIEDNYPDWPSNHAGTYRISVDRLAAYGLLPLLTEEG